MHARVFRCVGASAVVALLFPSAGSAAEEDSPPTMETEWSLEREDESERDVLTVRRGDETVAFVAHGAKVTKVRPAPTDPGAEKEACVDPISAQLRPVQGPLDLDADGLPEWVVARDREMGCPWRGECDYLVVSVRKAGGAEAKVTAEGLPLGRISGGGGLCSEDLVLPVRAKGKLGLGVQLTPQSRSFFRLSQGKLVRETVVHPALEAARRAKRATPLKECSPADEDLVSCQTADLGGDASQEHIECYRMPGSQRVCGVTTSTGRPRSGKSILSGEVELYIDWPSAGAFEVLESRTQGYRDILVHPSRTGDRDLVLQWDGEKYIVPTL